MNSTNLPQGWTWTNLADIGTINPRSINKELPDHAEVTFIPMRCVNEMGMGMDVSIIKKYVEVKRGYTPFITGDLLVAKITPCMENGKVVIAGKLKNGIGYGSTEFHVIRFHQDIAKNFYYYLFLREDIRKDARSHMTGTAGQLRVPASFIQNLKVPLPPLPEQHRIVTKIEELFTQLDAGVASLKKVQAQLKRYRQAVLKAAFEGRLTQDWRKEHKGEVEPTDIVIKKIRDKYPRDEKEISKRLPLDESELFQLPEGWTWVQTQDICENITNGYTPTSDKLFEDAGEIPFIKVYNLTKNGTLDFTIKPSFISRETHDTELKRSAVYPEDVLMNIVGPPLGKISLVPELYPVWNINQAIVIYRTFPEYNRKVLLFALLSDMIQKWLQKRGKTTAGQTNYTITMSRSLPIPFPPLKEQKIIVEEIERHFSQIDYLENTITTCLRKAESLRQSILKQAFEGRLVPQDPNDEPASVLLERIRAEKAQLQTKTKSPKTSKRINKNAR
jgi:type I restriction enzyme, S subunit